MSIKVYDSFDTTITITEKIEDEIEINFIDEQTQYIDNRGNDDSYPVFEITTPTSLTIGDDVLSMKNVFIKNGNQGIEFKKIDNQGNLSPISLTIGINDKVLLDFRKQDYKLYKHSDEKWYDIIKDLHYEIIFPTNKILKINANEFNELEYNFTGEVDLKINYEKYDFDNTQVRVDFRQNFKLTTDISYRTQRNFSQSKIVGRRKTSESYQFNLDKLSTNWYFYDNIASGKEYQIKITEDNVAGGNKDVRYLTGCTFDKFERSVSDGELTISNLSGTAQNLLKESN